MTSDLWNSDVLLEICVRADIEALRSLSRTSLWLEIRQFAAADRFWFLRVQALGHEVRWNPDVPWAEIWKAISFIRSQRHGSSRRSYRAAEDAIIRRFYLGAEVEAPEDDSIFLICCYMPAPSLVRKLLKLQYVDPTDPYSVEFYDACMRGDARTLDRLIPTLRESGHGEIIDLLLADRWRREMPALILQCLLIALLLFALLW